MNQHETETLIRLAEDEHQPMHVRTRVMDRLRTEGGEYFQANYHRIEKAERSMRRQLEIILKGQS